MKTQQQDRIRELVLGAGELEGAEHEAFLAREAGGDAQVLSAARERLRRAAEIPSGFLSSPAMEPSEKPTDSATSRLSPDSDTFVTWERYQVGAHLGTGGMGTVFKARDTKLKRTIALKFLLRIDDPETVQRFLHEAEAQARVEHENVLTVHETGERDGLPYIVLQYVDGASLMEVRDDTSLEQKVELLIAVAEGLHAAHLEGLVHGDVKPSNILVERQQDGRLKPYVTDFGLAREVAQDTAAAAPVAGSPCYMAPEQILESHGQLDRRADVYSLGATMYELLCGVVPFPGAASLEILHRALHEAPPPLRGHDRSLPAELEAIVHKCLEKHPERRYLSAHHVAQELRRFLDNEPVEAHTSTLVYRVGKWMVRYRALVTTGAVALALLMTVLVVFAVQTTIQARAIAREAERANREAATARQISGFLEAIFRLSDPGTAHGNTVTAREILDRAAERVELELRDQPLVQAGLMQTIGSVYGDLGLYEPAVHMLGQSLEIHRDQLGEEDVQVALLMGELAELHAQHGDLGRAAALHESALAILEARPEAPGSRVSTILALAALYAERGELARAEAFFERGLALREQALGAGDPQLAADRAQLARLYLWTGRIGRATELYRHSLGILARAHGISHPEVARVEHGLAQAVLAAGGLAEAEERLVRTLEIFRQVVPDGGELAPVHADLVRLRLAQGDLAAALAHGERAVAEAQRYSAANPGSRTGQRRLAAARLACGEALAAAGDAAGSAEQWRRGLAAIEPLTRGQQSVLGRDVHARLLRRLGRGDEARPLAQDLHARGWRAPELAPVEGSARL